MAQAATRETNKGRKNKIGDFWVDKVDVDVMRKFIAENKLDIDTDVTAEQLGVALTVYFRERTPNPDDMAKCDECAGEASDDVGDACPFCGITEPVVEDTAAEPDADAEEDDEPLEVAPTPKKTTTPKKAKKENEIMTAAAATTNGAAKTGELVQVKGKGAPMASVRHTEKELDKAIKEVVALKTGAVTSIVDLGHKLREINEKQLWRARSDEKGNPRYTGFDAFIHNELNMSPTYAYQIMKQAEQFSPADIARLGNSKIALILKAPPEDRKSLQEKVEKDPKGMSKRKLASEVQELKKKRGYTGDTEKAKVAHQGAKARAKKIAAKKEAPAKDKITIASIEGKKTIKLYAKPASMRNLDLSQCREAKTLGDSPFGMLELANEVVMTFEVKKSKSGKLIIVADTRRQSVAEAE